MRRGIFTLVLGLALTAQAEHAGMDGGTAGGKKRLEVSPVALLMRSGFNATKYVKYTRVRDGVFQYQDTANNWQAPKNLIIADKDGSFGGYEFGKFVRVDYKKGDYLMRDVRGNWFKAEKPTDVKNSDEDLPPLFKEVFRLINLERQRRGIAPLKIRPQLQQTAQNHTAWMARTGNLTHTSDGDKAENIAMGQTTAQQVVHSWMTSSGHRANILNASYKYTGVAAYKMPNGRIFWGQQFQF